MGMAKCNECGITVKSSLFKCPLCGILIKPKVMKRICRVSTYIIAVSVAVGLVMYFL